jgi:hypothetical protein
MRLDINEEANSVRLMLTDRCVMTSEEVRPGLTVQYDADGNVVGVEIERPGIDGTPSPEIAVDPLSSRSPRTPLGALLLETRRKLQEEGVPFLSDEELDREIADRRGRPPEERLA